MNKILLLGYNLVVFLKGEFLYDINTKGNKLFK